MAAENFDAWIPVEYAPDAIQRPDVLSAIESAVTSIPMSTTSKVYPRSGAASASVTAKGAPFAEDSGTNDNVTLTAAKFALLFRIDNEDLDDSLVDIIKVKQGEFARSYAKLLDNACLGTTAASNGGTVPFTSLYKALRSDETATGYTADENYISSVSGGLNGVTYAQLSDLLAVAEASDWFEPGMQLVVAHPNLKAVLRNIKDNYGRPIFVQGTAGTPDTLFELPIKWSLGARTSATASDKPSGNPLVFVVNPAYLLKGTRSDVEAAVDASNSITSDQKILMMRARKAFHVAVPNAHAVLEILP